KEGAILCYQLYAVNQDYLYGKIKKINQSEIVIDNNAYTLNEIVIIGGHTKLRQSVGKIIDFTGKTLMILGHLTSNAGVNMIQGNGDFYIVFAGAFTSGVGFSIWAAGYIIDLSVSPAVKAISPEYLDGNWIAEIVPLKNKNETDYNNDY
ncbi:MAG: hypothetical protein ACK4ON_13015, partial [Bacteroidia bacterium]